MADQPPARNPEQPAQPSTQLPIKPIIIKRTIVERPYIEGYPAQQPPDKHTGPIVIPPDIHVVQPPAQQQVTQPERIIIHEHPTRPPERYPEEVRNEPAPRKGYDTETVDPVRRSPVEPIPDAGRSEVLPVPEVTPIRKKNLPHPEEKSSNRGKPEVKASKQPDVPEVQKPEEKPSGSGSTTTKKLKVYNGEGGRIHTGKQIEEILDWYLQTGQLPDYVTDRQRYSYRHHRSLLERRHLLEQQGIRIVVHEINRQP